MCKIMANIILFCPLYDNFSEVKKTFFGHVKNGKNKESKKGRQIKEDNRIFKFFRLKNLKKKTKRFKIL